MEKYKQDYEYGGMLAKTWDLLRGDTTQWPDRFFYRHFIDRHGGRVLDVGCGTGRLLLDYLNRGVDIEGVDTSPEMLDLCRAKALILNLKPTLYLQSMEDLDLPQHYEIIIVPSSSFQLVTDLGDATKSMANFYRHLDPGGILIMPFMQLWREGDALETDWEQDGEKVRLEDGALIRRWSRARYDPKEQMEHTETRFEEVIDGDIVNSEHHIRSPATRWYTQQQALALYRQAGFSDLKIYSEFSQEPASEDDVIFSVVGLKPGSR